MMWILRVVVVVVVARVLDFGGAVRDGRRGMDEGREVARRWDGLRVWLRKGCWLWTGWAGVSWFCPGGGENGEEGGVGGGG